jgi:hypothetical protein
MARIKIGGKWEGRGGKLKPSRPLLLYKALGISLKLRMAVHGLTSKS